MKAPLFETRAPMPAKPQVNIDLVGNELTLNWQQRHWLGALFLLVWLTGWSAGCGFMAHKLLTDFEWFFLLFSVPFFSAWFVVAGILVVMLFGRQQMVLARRELRVASWALITYSRRTVPLEEVERAEADEVWDKSDDSPPTKHGIITINTLGQPVQFAKGIKDAEAEWLAETLNVCLDQMAPERAALTSFEAMHERVETDNPIDADEDFLEETGNEDDIDSLVFEPSRQRKQKPSDSHWELRREGRALQFLNRGRWSLGAFAGVTFINLFWNGIVGVFIVQLVQDFQWFLALFLIPFEAIGLVMIGAWLATLTAPAWGTSYRFRLGRIERRWWGPLLGKTKTHEFDRLDRIEISDTGADESNAIKIPPTSTGESGFELAFIDTDNVTQLTIDSLTKGDALWMADTIMFELPSLFNRDR